MENALGMVALVGVLGATAVQAVGADLDAVVAAARSADIVIIGEIHDNPAHHQMQEAIVSALRPSALVFEMIPQAREDTVNTLRERGAPQDEIAAALDWAETGWPDFAYYADILDAAPEARIFGAGQPMVDVRRAAAEGAAGGLWSRRHCLWAGPRAPARRTGRARGGDAGLPLRRAAGRGTAGDGRGPAVPGRRPGGCRALGADDDRRRKGRRHRRNRPCRPPARRARGAWRCRSRRCRARGRPVRGGAG